MFINPMSSSIELMETRLVNLNKEDVNLSQKDTASPSFLDVFTGIVNDAAETQSQKNQDMMDIMLGDTDNIEEVQANIAKAEVSLDLLVNVKNSVVDSYNEILRMSI